MLGGGNIGAGLGNLAQGGASGGGAVGGATSGTFGAQLGGTGGGAVPSATEDIIKLQDKIIKQQNKCVSYSF